MSDEFAGKVVVVTGASGNVGQVVARTFGAAGAKVVLVGRAESELADLANELGGLAVGADVTEEASVDELIQKTAAQFGRIDILAHTVGGFAAGQAVHEAGVDLWERMMKLNGRSVWVTCGRVARYMVEQGIQGKITTILSKNAYQGTAKAAAYSASKAAAQRVIESMAAELGGRGINVNAIVPSMIDTPQNRESSPTADYSKWVKPEQIAQAVQFLSSDAARSINGVSLNIYGQG